MIEFKNFSFKYPGAGRSVLDNLNCSFSAGEMVLIAGPNGSGKSTLLKAILGIVPFATGGSASGRVEFEGNHIRAQQTVQLAGKIGVVLQDPESQVTNLTVWEEVVFGMANLLVPIDEVVERGYRSLLQLGLARFAEQSVLTLSGGQLQRLTLASLLSMQPQVLVLDEPLANLDPLGVNSVVTALREIRHFVPLTIICSHWLDPFMELATRIVIVSEGKLVLDVPASELSTHTSQLISFGVEVPFYPQPKDGLRLNPRLKNRSIQSEEPILLRGVGYYYPDSASFSLSEIVTSLNSKRIALVGHNGCGKSTLARLLAGLAKPTVGQIEAPTKVGLMLQKPTLSFLCPTVEEELRFGWKPSDEEVERLLVDFELADYRDASPFNLSGGEQRRLALSLALAQRPELLILDEPTAGLDAVQVKNLLEKVEKFNGAIIFITHDTRIVAEYVDEVVALRDGNLWFVCHPVEMTAQMMRELGYDKVNPTVAWAMSQLDAGIPMLPSQVKWEVDQ